MGRVTVTPPPHRPARAPAPTPPIPPPLPPPTPPPSPHPAYVEWSSATALAMRTCARQRAFQSPCGIIGVARIALAWPRRVPVSRSCDLATQCKRRPIAAINLPIIWQPAFPRLVSAGLMAGRAAVPNSSRRKRLKRANTSIHPTKALNESPPLRTHDRAAGRGKDGNPPRSDIAEQKMPAAPRASGRFGSLSQLTSGWDMHIADSRSGAATPLKAWPRNPVRPLAMVGFSSVTAADLRQCLPPPRR
jgi:hypothetical protein